MAIAYDIVSKGVAGNMRQNVVDITLDGSYASGGYALTAASLGVANIFVVIAQMKTGENLLPQYNHATGKLEILKGASTTTVTTGSGAFSELATNDTYASSSVVVRCLVIGDMVNVG
jgi:hypothetical protein